MTGTPPQPARCRRRAFAAGREEGAQGGSGGSGPRPTASPDYARPQAPSPLPFPWGLVPRSPSLQPGRGARSAAGGQGGGRGGTLPSPTLRGGPGKGRALESPPPLGGGGSPGDCPSVTPAAALRVPRGRPRVGEGEERSARKPNHLGSGTRSDWLPETLGWPPCLAPGGVLKGRTPRGGTPSGRQLPSPPGLRGCVPAAPTGPGGPG